MTRAYRTRASRSPRGTITSAMSEAPTDTRSAARRPRSDAAANRERILAAATIAVRRDGERVPMATIADEAGVGIGTLYRHYPTRPALLAALTLRSFHLVLEHARAAALSDEPAPAALEHFLEQTIAARNDFVLPLHGGPVIHDEKIAAASNRDPEPPRTGPRPRTPRPDHPTRRHPQRHHHHRSDARPTTPARSPTGTNSPAGKPRSSSQASPPPNPAPQCVESEHARGSWLEVIVGVGGGQRVLGSPWRSSAWWRWRVNAIVHVMLGADAPGVVCWWGGGPWGR